MIKSTQNTIQPIILPCDVTANLKQDIQQEKVEVGTFWGYFIRWELNHEKWAESEKS